MSAAEKVTHTPGPWQSLFDADGDHAIFGPDNALVAVTSGEPHIDSWTDEANARLIAAAPDMLEALEVLLDVAPFAADPLTQVIHAKAEAAIRKAKGESQ